MAALQQHVGGQPEFTQKSFATAVLSGSSQSQPAQTAAQDLPTTGLHKGLPSIAFTDHHMLSLSKSFSWSLIAKFSTGYNKKDPKLGRPSVENLNRYFVAMDFKQPFSLGLLDNRHAILHFRCEEDYLRLYSRTVWYVGAVTMRILKWTPYFRVDQESSVVPVWITFPRLPIQFFLKEALFPICKLIGQPLRMDSATASMKRPSVARVQVEIDVLQPRPEKIWIQMGSKKGYWQPVEFENVPSYCSHCWHLGHSESVCRVLNSVADGQHLDKPADVSRPPQSQQQFVPKRGTSVAALTQQLTPPSEQGQATTVASIPRVDNIHHPHSDKEKQSIIPQVQNPAVEACAGTVAISGPASAQILPTQPSVSGSAVKANSASQPNANELIAVTPYPHAFIGANLGKWSGPPMTQVVTAAPRPSVKATNDQPQSCIVDESNGNSVADPPIQERGLVLPQTDIAASPTVQMHTTEAITNNQAQNLQSLAVDSLKITSTVEDSAYTAPTVLQAVGEGDSPQNEAPTQLANLILQDTELATQDTPLNPLASAFFPSLADTFRTSPSLGTGYNDSVYYGGSESDIQGNENETASGTSYDITDGSEGTIRQKRRAQKKSKAYTSSHMISKEDFEAQSRSLGKKIKKKGRPPGSRNRTFFDVIRTMETRAMKSTTS